MKVIKTEQLVEKLNKLENKYIVLALEGNIEEEIHMKIAEVNIEFILSLIVCLQKFCKDFYVMYLCSSKFY